MSVRAANLRKSYGKTHVVRDLSLDIAPGEMVALLGPSGCGKTTTLRMIAGLNRLDAGTLHIGERLVDDGRTFVAPEKRALGMVFQSYAIWPHMSVAENVAYPLKRKGMATTDIAAAVIRALDLVRLGAMRDRMPHQLSGGQLQRVALARALVREPEVLLLDEPLSNLDAALREELRAEIAALRSRVRTTMVYVTHDQTEALTFADKVVVMYDGEIVQVGSPADLFNRPEHTFVGHFIGSPGMNIMPARLDGAAVRFGEHSVPLAAAPRLEPSQKLQLGVRPEFVRLSATGIPATIVRMEDAGRYRVAHLDMLGMPVAAMLREGEGAPAAPHVSFDPAGVHLYADSWRVDLGGAAQ